MKKRSANKLYRKIRTGILAMFLLIAQLMCLYVFGGLEFKYSHLILVIVLSILSTIFSPKANGYLLVDDSNQEKTKMLLQITDCELEDIAFKPYIELIVDTDAILNNQEA